MKASELMLERATLYADLVHLDQHLLLSLSSAPKNRINRSSSALLTSRSRLCRNLIAVGYSPWAAPLNINESRVP